MNAPQNPPEPDRSDDEQVVRDRTLDDVLAQARRWEPTEAALRRVTARAASLADDAATVGKPAKAHSAIRPSRPQAFLAAATLAAGFLIVIAVWRPTFGPSPAPAPPSSDVAPPVASNASPVTSVTLTAISFRAPEADLDVAEQRIERLSERAILEEIRREAQLAATRFRNWND